MFSRPVLWSISLVIVALFVSNINKIIGLAGYKAASRSTMSTMPAKFTASPKLPIYFFSHGGPTFMYPEDSFSDPGAYQAVKRLGKYIKEEIKPKFIIVVSAHWETYNRIEVSVPKDVLGGNSENELIYDFSGFPRHMYEEKFRSRGDVSLSKDIKHTLQQAGLAAQLTPRGLDHGVWVPFKVAFSTNKLPEEEWDVDVPLIQVSLDQSSDFALHRQLGNALATYRDRGGLIICSGMSVHNLRDMHVGLRSPNKPLPYVKPFNSLLTETVVGKVGDERFQALENIPKEHRQLFLKAHPTPEHFMPMVVAVGAAGSDAGIEVSNSALMSLGWGVYQFGKYSKL